MANLNHGIDAVVIYDPAPAAGAVAAVLFDQLDAEKSSITTGGVAEGDRRDARGNMFYPGDMAEMEIEGRDSGGTRLVQLRTWYSSNKEVSAVALGTSGQQVIHWTESNLLHEPKPTTIRSAVAGRSDFSRFQMMRHGGSHKIYRRVNFVAHLDDLDGTIKTDQVRTFVFPIPGIPLYVAVDIAIFEAGATPTYGLSDVLQVDYLDSDGTVLSTAMQTLSTARVELQTTTPDTVHSVRVTVVGAGAGTADNAAYKVTNLSVRGDGSYDYTND